MLSKNLSSSPTNKLTDHIQEIQTLVSTDKTTLRKLIAVLNESYRDAKELQQKRPKDALKIIDNSLIQIFALNNILQEKFTDTESFQYWSNNINLLTNKNNILKTAITNQILVAQIAKQNNKFTFHDLWNDDTLQEPHYVETFKQIALPVIHPTLYMKNYKTIVLQGNSNTGKSYTIRKIKELLEHLQIPCKFYNVSGIELETKIEHIEQLVLQTPTVHNFFVTELPPFDVQMNWTTQMMTKWYLSLEKDAFHNTTWIVLCRQKEVIPQDVFRMLKPLIISYKLPNSNTIQLYLEKKIKEMYHIQNDINDLPDYINLPILEDVAELSKLCNYLEKQKYDFDSLVTLLRNGLKYNLSLAMNENAVYEIDREYYLKNSLKNPLQIDYRYFIVSDSEKDLLSLSSSEDYWNVHILDKLQSVEDNRMVGIWVNNHEKKDMNVIAAFEVKTSEHSYHIDNHMQYMYKCILHWYLQLWKNIFNSNRTISTKYAELAKMMELHRADIFTVYDDDSLMLLDHEVLREIFFSHEDFVTVYKKGIVEELNSFTVSNYQYLVFNSEDLSETNIFYLTYGKEQQKVHAALTAEEMRDVISTLTNLEVFVNRIKFADGYVWCVEFQRIPQHKLMSVRSENSEDYTTVFCGFDMTEEMQLPENYCITNESDLDLLSQAYPADFKDCFRDETETWLLFPLEKQHIDKLELNYSNEQIFYCSLYFHAMKLQNPLMTEQQKSHLSELVENLRTQLDYIFLLTPSITDDAENGNWDDCLNHPHQDDAESNYYKTDKKIPFNVNPYYLLELLYTFSSDKKILELRQLLEDYLQHKQVPQLENNIIYVKSTISKTEWSKAIAMDKKEVLLSDKFINSGVYSFIRSLRKTLYYQLFKHATMIGIMDEVNVDVKDKMQIKWYSFVNDNNLNELLRSFRKKHNLYTGKHLDNMSYLSSFVQLSAMDQEMPLENAFFATLLYPEVFYTHEKRRTNLLEDVQQADILQMILSYFDISDTRLNMLKYEFNSNLPKKIDDKNIIDNNLITRIKFIYGLKASHLEAQVVIGNHTV